MEYHFLSPFIDSTTAAASITYSSGTLSILGSCGLEHPHTFLLAASGSDEYGLRNQLVDSFPRGGIILLVFQ
jgi:hypothetical protein